MFVCDVCGSVTAPGAPCHRVTVETRDVEYPKRDKAHWHPPRPPKEKGKWVADPGGFGHETVREVRACPQCAAVGASADLAARVAVAPADVAARVVVADAPADVAARGGGGDEARHVISHARARESDELGEIVSSAA